MDETESDEVVTVGQRLREAREAKGLSIEEIAAQTRIPTRHLASLEVSEWDKLPAATYSIGFAKNYAGVVGLDRTEIGDQLRAEMGGSQRRFSQLPKSMKRSIRRGPCPRAWCSARSACWSWSCSP